MQGNKSKTAKGCLLMLISIPVIFTFLLVTGEMYRRYFTATSKTAIVEKASDHYLIMLKRTRPIGGHFELNPIRWFYGHIINECIDLKLPKIEGKIEGEIVYSHNSGCGSDESELLDYPKLIPYSYDGLIEFSGKNEMKINFRCDVEMDCRYWNRTYELIHKR